MTDIDPIVLKIDRLISLSRLNELAVIVNTDRVDRLVQIAAAVKQLKPGAYLLSTGPATTGIIPLGRRGGDRPSRHAIGEAV